MAETAKQAIKRELEECKEKVASLQAVYDSARAASERASNRTSRAYEEYSAAKDRQSRLENALKAIDGLHVNNG